MKLASPLIAVLFAVLATGARAAISLSGPAPLFINPADPLHRAQFRTAVFGSGADGVVPFSEGGDWTIVTGTGITFEFLTGTVVSVAGPVNALSSGGVQYDQSRQMFVTGPTSVAAQLLGVQLRNDTNMVLTEISLRYNVQTLVPYAQGAGEALDTLAGIGMDPALASGFGHNNYFFNFPNQEVRLSSLQIRPGEFVELMFMDDNGPASGLAGSRSEGLYGLSGIQISGMVFIPEPASQGLVALAGFALSSRRRRPCAAQ